MASALAASSVTARPCEKRATFKQTAASRSAVAVRRQRAAVSCAAARDSNRLQTGLNLVAASAAALLVSLPGPALAAQIYDVADVTGTEQSDRVGLGPNEVDRKDLASLPNASPKDAAVPAIQKVATPGKKQDPKPVPKELQQGVEGALSADRAK
jgi:hypothetical protein